MVLDEKKRGCEGMCHVGEVGCECVGEDGRGLVMLCEDGLGWVNLSEVGNSWLSFCEAA